MAASGCASSAAAQQLVKGVPYSATVVHTGTTPDQTTLTKVARASNGSTYTALVDTGPGHRAPLVSIFDGPARRFIILDPNTKTYTVQPAGIPPLHDGQTDEAHIRERVEYLGTLQPKHEEDGAMSNDVVPLGFRTVDGYVEFGMRRTFTNLSPTSTLRQKVWDMWERPALYADVEKIGYDDQGNPTNVMKLTDIQTTEPDPHLFEIPQDYVPASAHPIR